jgi:helicase
MLQALKQGKKAIYVVPLIALASEKFKQFKEQWGSLCTIALSVGDLDSSSTDLGRHDVIVCTAEKMDSLVRHQVKWLSDVGCLVVDEIHLLNDHGRGPVLEVLITVLRRLLPKLQIVGLSATIGNPEELADWLQAELVRDTWRPVPLHQGVYVDGKIEFDQPAK